jgi:ATP-binding cassette subfamily B protein
MRTNLIELGMRLVTLAGYGGILYLLVTSLLDGRIGVGAFAAVFGSIGMLFGVMEEIVCRHIGQMTKDLGTVHNFVRFLDLPERSGREMTVRRGRSGSKARPSGTPEKRRTPSRT